MEPFLVTERLLLRAFTDADLDAVIALDGDPEVMRYLGDGRPASPDVVEHALTRAEGERRGPTAR